MRRLLLLTAAATMMASMATAQTPPASPPAPAVAPAASNGAVNGAGNHPSSVNVSGTINIVAPDALEKGANSFTQGQAQARIESAGFTDVNDLHQDDQGIWRGKATRDGKPVTIGFDYKGNVAAQ